MKSYWLVIKILYRSDGRCSTPMVGFTVCEEAGTFQNYFRTMYLRAMLIGILVSFIAWAWALAKTLPPSSAGLFARRFVSDRLSVLPRSWWCPVSASASPAKRRARGRRLGVDGDVCFPNGSSNPWIFGSDPQKIHSVDQYWKPKVFNCCTSLYILKSI